jgi:DedD protein
MTQTQDTEITLGTGKLLGIFFGLVTLCAVFFTMGYLLGRSTGPAGATTQMVGTVPSGSPANKPAAGNKTDITVQPAPAGTGPDSSFYNSVNNKTPDTQLQPPQTSAPPDQTAKPPEQAGTPAPEMKNAPAGSYMVQVAAVSKKEDADILVAALRKKEYPVFIVSNVPGDALFHVQVGPFTDPKEAETMRSRLAGDGYNAIVKK